MRSGTELAREIKLTDWSIAENPSNRSSGVQIPRDICTRYKRYLYSAKCSWIIISQIHVSREIKRANHASREYTCTTILQVNVKIFSTKFEGWCKYFSPIKLVSLRKLALSRNAVCTGTSSDPLSSVRMAWTLSPKYLSVKPRLSMKKGWFLEVESQQFIRRRKHSISTSVMYQSNRSFNIPPSGIPRAFDVFSCPGGREFD